MMTLMWILLGVIIGWYGRVAYAIYQVKQFALQMKLQENGDVDKPRVQVNIEKKDDVYYVYDRQTDVFLAQGKTVDEINAILEKSFPNVSFVADYEHMAGLVGGGKDESI